MMQPGVTWVLATIWLVLSVGVVGAATHHPSRPTLDQYSPLAPHHHRHPVYQRAEGRPDWKDQDPRLSDLSIGPGRSITGKEFPGRTFEVNYPGKDLTVPREDDVSGNDFSPLPEDKRSRNIARQGHRGKPQESRAIPAVEPDDPFVADETFQDQGPGSVEIYKLDLFKENSLLGPATTTSLPVKSKRKSVKKTGRVGWKAKTNEYKTKLRHRQSNLFDEPDTEVPVNSESFGVGGVPELQVGCEGLEASSHKSKRSIDEEASKERGQPRPLLHSWPDATPVSLDLDYELSEEEDDEGYEEMDELVRLKKLEVTTPRIKHNRGDMDATIHQDDHHGDKGYPERLPVRGDLGNASKVVSPAELTANDRASEDARGNLIGSTGDNLNDGSSRVNEAGGPTGNQGRRLLWAEDSAAEHPVDRTRLKRAIWGFAEDEGVVSSDELQTVNQRRRQEYERRKQAAEELRRRNYVEDRSNGEANKVRDDYERELEQRRREEEERRRRVQQENADRRWEEERRREEVRRRQQELNRRGGQSPRNREEEERLRELRMRDEARRREEEERRRQEAEAYRRRPDYPYRRRPEDEARRQHEEETRRRELERRRQEQRSRMLEEERLRAEQYRYQEEAERRRDEEQRRREMHETSRNMPEEDRRSLEERQRQWRMKEQEARRGQDRNRNEAPSNILYPSRSGRNETRTLETEADRRLTEQRERERTLLREYQTRGVNMTDRTRSDADRRRYRPENRQDQNGTSRGLDEHNRRRAEERRRRLEEERRYQEYVRRNQPKQAVESNGSRWHETRTIEEARQRSRPGYPGPDSGRRNHGPLAPVYIDPRGSEDRRREEDARRLEDERRMQERRRQEQEELRREMQRREEEARKSQSRRYEEERRRQEAVRLAEERRKKELIEEETRRGQAGGRRPPENRRLEHGDRGRPLEYTRRGQDTGLIPANLHFNESRVATERERQRQEHERRRIMKQRPEENRATKEQRRRQEEARLNALPVSARIIIRPGVSSRFGSDTDFVGINPSRQGVQVPRFPVPPTANPPAKSPGPCVWAVVHCCSANTIRYVTCFESLGCPGINWDPNPCRRSVAQAALDEIMKFYAAAEKDDSRFKK